MTRMGIFKEKSRGTTSGLSPSAQLQFSKNIKFNISPLLGSKSNVKTDIFTYFSSLESLHTETIGGKLISESANQEMFHMRAHQRF